MARKKTPIFLTEQGAFPTRLRTLMEEMGTTQEELGKAIGVTRQAVGNYVSGQSSPSWESLVAIAKHFNVSADYLLGLSDAATSDPTAKEMCDYLGLDIPSLDIIRKHSDTFRILCSSRNAESFLDAFAEISKRKSILQNNIDTHRKILELSESGKSFVEMVLSWKDYNLDLESLAHDLPDDVKLFKFAIYDFSECARQLAENVFDIRGTLYEVKIVDQQIKEMLPHVE